MASELFDTYDLDTGSPPKPQQSYKKTWNELRNTVRETRKMITRHTPSVPSNFEFRILIDEFGNSTCRLYFLGVLEKGRDSTLLQADLPEETTSQTVDSDGWETNPLLWVTPVFATQPGTTAAPMSRDEELMRERKRLGTYGITSYEFNREDGLFVIPANNCLYICRDAVDSACVPVQVGTSAYGAKLDPKICATNTDLVAFIHESDIWLTCLHSRKELRLTHTHRGFAAVEKDYLSAGVPSFVIQEEFDRYTGYWWSPTCQRLADGRRVYHILYEEVDEKDVDLLSLFAPTGQEPNVDLFRYPKAGANNARSNLKMLEISLTCAGPSTEVIDLQVRELIMRERLFVLCPWAEYLSRVGWTADGKYVFAVLMDRLQQRLAIVLLSPSSFSANGNEAAQIQYIYEESSEIWINVHDCIYFFSQTSENEIAFLFASEKSGFRHIYLIRSQLKFGKSGPQHNQHRGQGDSSVEEGGACQVLSEVAVTSGPWVVLSKEIWVDESRRMVYFMGLKDSPLESHLYATRYDQPSSPILRLTEMGYSHSVQISPDFTKFVTVFSSIHAPAQSTVYKIMHQSDGTIRCGMLGPLTPSIGTVGYCPPNLFHYPSRAGHMTYGLYFLPRGCEPGRRYPTVLFVYGGPQVQMVTNSFKGQKFLRLHTLAAEGYVVIVIDGRGSTNRGLEFESILKNKLGTLEINDQVEGLLWLASQTDVIDTSRVAIHGWSYGGYLSLMGLAQRNDIFKVAIAGAPVVSWELYDTGYTERYLGLPQCNGEVYKASSVLTYVDMLPDFDTKLLLIHGLIDENVHFQHSSALINQLVMACKPHQLQVYPNERHGIRSHDASEHYKTTVLKFLQDHL